MCNIRCLSTNTPNIRYVPTYLKKHPGTWETFCSYLPEETSRNLRNILFLLTWRNIQELEKHSVPTYLKKHPGTWETFCSYLPEETSRNSTSGSSPPHWDTASWLGRLPMHNTRIAFTAFTRTSSNSESSRFTNGKMPPFSAMRLCEKRNKNLFHKNKTSIKYQILTHFEGKNYTKNKLDRQLYSY